MTAIKLDFTSGYLGPDGFSRIQRAILRQLSTHPDGLRCSHLIMSLLEAQGCPRGITPEAIDITMLTMSHPRLSSSPILEYIGNIGSEDGFIPGTTYRYVALGKLAHAIWQPKGKRHSTWDETPLTIRAPCFLVTGAASWRASYESRVPMDEQRGVKVWCNRIHCLGSPLHSVSRAYTTAQGSPRSAFLKNLLQCRLRDAVLGCACPWPFSVSATPLPMMSTPRVGIAPFTQAFADCLPYGRLLALSWSSNCGGPVSRLRVVSLPKVELAILVDGTALLAAIQAACGMEFGKYWNRIDPSRGLTSNASADGKYVGTRCCRASKLVIDALAKIGRTEIPLSPLPLAEYERIFL